MSEASHHPGSPQCWKHIGVWGDRSCSELVTYAHCRGCPEYALAGRRIFDRDPPAGYRRLWQERLAQPPNADVGQTVSLMIFALGRETFALRTLHLSEVIATRGIRRIPHRDASVLHGLVNVHGLLRPCVSIAALLGVGAGEAPTDPGALVLRMRMLVVRAGGGPLVMPVDAVHGTHPVPSTELRAPPATVGGDASRFTTAVFDWRNRAVGVLDGETLFAALEMRLA